MSFAWCFYKLSGQQAQPSWPYQHTGPQRSKVSERQPTRQGQWSKHWLWRGQLQDASVSATRAWECAQLEPGLSSRMGSPAALAPP